MASGQDPFAQLGQSLQNMPERAPQPSGVKAYLKNYLLSLSAGLANAGPTGRAFAGAVMAPELEEQRIQKEKFNEEMKLIQLQSLVQDRETRAADRDEDRNARLKIAQDNAELRKILADQQKQIQEMLEKGRNTRQDDQQGFTAEQKEKDRGLQRERQAHINARAAATLGREPGQYTKLFDDAGNTILVNPKSGRIFDPRSMGSELAQFTRGSAQPMGVRERVASLDTMVEQLDVARSLAAQNPDAIGPVDARWESVKAVTVGNSPDVAVLRRIVKDTNTNLVYVLSGKQINEAERADIKQTMAKLEDPDSNFFENLNDLQKKLSAVANRLRGTAAGPASSRSPDKPGSGLKTFRPD